MSWFNNSTKGTLCCGTAEDAGTQLWCLLVIFELNHLRRSRQVESSRSCCCPVEQADQESNFHPSTRRFDSFGYHTKFMHKYRILGRGTNGAPSAKNTSIHITFKVNRVSFCSSGSHSCCSLQRAWCMQFLTTQFCQMTEGEQLQKKHKWEDDSMIQELCVSGVPLLVRYPFYPLKKPPPDGKTQFHFPTLNCQCHSITTWYPPKQPDMNAVSVKSYGEWDKRGEYMRLCISHTSPIRTAAHLDQAHKQE